MADARNVVLYSGAAVVASGVSDVVDIFPLHSLLRGSIVVDSVTGSGDGVEFLIQTSADGSTGWRTAFDFLTSRVDVRQFVVDELDRYVRLSWSLSGVTSVTFSCSAESHVLYATRRDQRLKSLSEQITGATEVEVLAEMLLSASGDAEDALNAQYALPLTTWSDSLRERVVSVAKYKFFNREGFAPQGVDELIVKDYDDAVIWFDKVARRKIVLSGVAESVIEPVRVSSGNTYDPVPAPRFTRSWGDY